MASRTCSELQRLVQALSTSCCLVSNFEIWCARGLEFTHGPRPAKPPAAMQQPARPAQLACGQPLGLPKGPPAGTAPFSKGGAATAAGNWGNKWRSRPISRVLSWTVIPLGATSPLRSSSLPGPDAGHVMRSLFGLAPGGVCRAGLLPGSRCALTAPFHPCHARLATPFGGIFLLHFPSARAAQALPGTVPCGARTFLGTHIHRNGCG